ncbi:MAG TPA: low temperature requirement protein A [Mucilaginibacter sp.]|jgi:low temperature requirement protein LtrA|nr:low temperature requirement protein A [Mucilaginibacter sp.]
MAKHVSPQWWGPPKNFADRKNERKISWLELFYDLVYVAAIGQLTHRIAVSPTWGTVGYSFLLFCMIFWSWVNGSQYYDLHGGDGIRTRLLTFWQMLGMAAVAITMPDVFDGNQQGFAITFAVLQILVTYMWWSVGLYDPSHRVFNKFYTINYSIAFALLIASIFTNCQTAIVLWVIALVFNLTAPLAAARTVIRVLKERKQPAFTASATIVERFGLFTIIVLTESIVSTVGGVGDVKDKQPAVWVVFILGILIAFLIWNLYFDMTSEQETKKGFSYFQYFIFLHFLLLAALATAGACMRVLMADAGTVPTLTLQWMFCVAIAVILLTITGLTRIMEEDEEDRAYITPVSGILVVAAIIVVALPFFGDYLNSALLLTVIAAVLFVPVVIGVRSWVKFRFFNRKT